MAKPKTGAKTAAKKVANKVAAAASKPATKVTPAKASVAAPARPTEGKASKRLFETADRFWEVWLEGTTVYTRFGKPGASGQTKLKTLPTKEVGQTELEKQIAAKVADGFEEAEVAYHGADPRNPTLEAAIAADPYDDDAYSIYADWLLEQGDPRGELIALSRSPKTEKQIRPMVAKHAAYFLGPLAEHALVRDRYGWDKKAEREAFQWHNGFIKRVRLSHNVYADAEWKGELSDVLAALLAHPSGRFVLELVVNYNGDPSEDNLQSILDVLAKALRPMLRQLVLGDDVDQISWYHVGNLSKVWKALPELTSIEIEAGSFTLGQIDAPKLRVARFETGGLSKASARSIAKINAPNLEELEVYFGDDEYGGDSTAKDIAPLLQRGDLAKLKRLGLKNAKFADELCELLAFSKLLPQLETLDLSMGIMTDAGAKVLADNAAKFAHLERLDLGENYLSPGGQKLVKKIAKRVAMDAMKTDDDDDPEYRYVSIAE